MLLDQKFQPQTLDDIVFNEETARILKNYSLSSIPHLIIHGRPGSGKRTLVYAFINHMFNKKPLTHQRSIEITTSSDKKFTIDYIESNEYVEICPSDYNFKDKDVMQTMIKSMAETKPIASLISEKRNKLKLVVITKADKLTKDAQAALRRTLETYADNFRMILICNDVTGIIDPIMSRMLCLRVTVAPSPVLLRTLTEINKCEDIGADENMLKKIINSCDGNFRRALFFLQKIQLADTDETKTKRQKISQEDLFRLDWEITAVDIIKQIMKDQSNTTILNVRTQLNEMLIKCIPPKLILKILFKTALTKMNKTKHLNLCRISAKYDGRITLGTKSIFHLEAYIIALMMLFR